MGVGVVHVGFFFTLFPHMIQTALFIRKVKNKIKQKELRITLTRLQNDALDVPVSEHTLRE